MEPTEDKGPQNPNPTDVPSPSPSPSPAPTNLSKDERLWASLAHLGGVVASFIAPLVIWFMKREESAFINDQAKEATNFQLSVAIVVVACLVLTVVPLVGCFIWIGALGGWVVGIVFSVIGAIKANEGVTYRYPFTLRLIK